MTSTAAGRQGKGKERGTGEPTTPATPQLWYARLAGGLRPFLAFHRDAAPDRGWWGWIFPDPHVDGGDLLLREAGIPAADRWRPCYLLVPLDRLPVQARVPAARRPGK